MAGNSNNHSMIDKHPRINEDSLKWTEKMIELQERKAKTACASVHISELGSANRS